MSHITKETFQLQPYRALHQHPKNNLLGDIQLSFRFSANIPPLQGLNMALSSYS